MPSHYWGDDWFEKNGDNLNKAINFCLINWKKYGRIGSHGKEKYGTFRHHMYFFYNSEPLFELIYPGYVYNRFPRWLRTLDVKVFSKLFKYTGLAYLIQRYQFFIYNAVIQIANRKYPGITDELVSDSDAPRAIRPGLFGKVDGLEIRNKFWSPKMRRDGSLEKE